MTCRVCRVQVHAACGAELAAEAHCPVAGCRGHLLAPPAQEARFGLAGRVRRAFRRLSSDDWAVLFTGALGWGVVMALAWVQVRQSEPLTRGFAWAATLLPPLVALSQVLGKDALLQRMESASSAGRGGTGPRT